MWQFLRRSLITIMMFTVVFVAVFGFMSGESCFAKKLSKDTVKNLMLFSKVYTLIKHNYIKKENSEKLIFGAIEGMVFTLDPHTYFLTPNEFGQMKAETSGEFVGIGIKISVRNHYIVIISPIDGSPAAKAGIRSGDIIKKINGISTYNMNIIKAVGILKGKAGTAVNLLIERKAFKKPRVFRLVRKNVILKSISYMILSNHIAYVRIASFQEHTNKQLLKALQIMSFKEHGIKGLIIDLRNNPGGLLNQAVKVCSDFIKSGLVVYTKGRKRAQDIRYFTLYRKTHFKYPIVVLVNSGTASAAEITAGSLQAHKRAVIVGTQTFGKGSVQTIFTLPEGAGIGLTTAFYFLPNGVSVQDTGVTPNFIVRNAKDFVFVKHVSKSGRLREVDLRHHFKNPESGDIRESHKIRSFKMHYKKDNQFRFAYELLRSWNFIQNIGAK